MFSKDVRFDETRGWHPESNVPKPNKGIGR